MQLALTEYYLFQLLVASDMNDYAKYVQCLPEMNLNHASDLAMLYILECLWSMICAAFSWTVYINLC